MFKKIFSVKQFIEKQNNVINGKNIRLLDVAGFVNLPRIIYTRSELNLHMNRSMTTWPPRQCQWQVRLFDIWSWNTQIDIHIVCIVSTSLKGCTIVCLYINTFGVQVQVCGRLLENWCLCSFWDKCIISVHVTVSHF